MRVLVSGHLGYIGSVLTRNLALAGHNVRGYDIGWFARPGVTFTPHDLRDRDEPWPDSVGYDPEVVVHLAGLSNDPMGELSPAVTWEINYWGTIGFVSRFPRARHVVVSSCAVYGQADDLCDETSKPNPQTTYASCKAKVDAWLEDRGYNHAILRLGTVYGHSPNHRLDLVVNRMVFDAVNDRVIRVSGNAARPLVHVEDVASAIQWAAEGGAQGIYNVVGENIRMQALADEVSPFAPLARITALPAPTDTRDYMASGTKLSRAGWHPTRTVAASLPRLFEETRAYTHENEGDHIRLTTLRRLMDAGDLDRFLRKPA